MIFVKNLKSVSDQEWSTTEKYPGVRGKFLIDADFMGSSGLSLGFAEIAPGGDLTLHYHSPAEIYVVTVEHDTPKNTRHTNTLNI